jgi:predicted RNase H-like HicB family nuclease
LPGGCEPPGYGQETFMTMYIGILDGEAGAYGVRVPDCPGAFGGGETAEAAVADAVSALAAWADAATKDGEAMPRPRTLAALMADPDDAPAPGEAVVMLPLLLDQGRTVRANVTMDAGLLAAIDAAADQRGLTRSAFLASAAREKIVAGR